MNNNKFRNLVRGGIVWNAVGQMGGQALQFLTTLVLARLLAPEDFGTVAMATSFTFLAGTINQFGISPAIVQRKSLTEGHLSSAFWVNLCVGFVLTLVTLALARPLAIFYNIAQVEPVLSVLSIVFLLGSLKIVHTALLVKSLKYKKLAVATFFEMLTNAFVSIGLAIAGFGVWSIVYGRIAGVSVGTLVIIVNSNWKPRAIFDLEKFKELFTFGVQAMGVSFLSYFLITLDNIIVGKYLGAIALGVYSLSYNIITMPQKRISSVVSGVAFSAFSEIQDDKQRVREGYFKMLKMLSFVTFPLLGGLFAVAPEFVSVVLGEKWIDAIGPLRILCFAGILRALTTTVGSIYFSQGRPDIELKLDLLSLAGLSFALIIGAQWGLVGIAISVSLHCFVMQIFYFRSLAKLIGTSTIHIYGNILNSLVCTALMVISVICISSVTSTYSINQVLQLVVCILFGFGFYVLFSFIFNRNDLIVVLDSIGLHKVKLAVRTY